MSETAKAIRRARKINDEKPRFKAIVHFNDPFVEVEVKNTGHTTSLEANNLVMKDEFMIGPETWQSDTLRVFTLNRTDLSL